MIGVSVGQVRVETDGEGAPIVFVHGLGATSNSFHPLLGALRGYRCVLPDLPGAGRSPLPYGTLSIAGFVEAVLSVTRALGATPAHFVGHSMGTLVCQHLAAQEPGLVRSLTLFGAILEPPDAARERLRERARLARRDGMVGIADAVSQGGLSSATRASEPLAVPFVRELHMRQDPEGFAQACEALADAQAADLRFVRCPTLVVTGEDDAVAPPSMAQEIAARVKGAQVKLLARCGHWTPLERPAECSGHLAEFVKGVDAA